MKLQTLNKNQKTIIKISLLVVVLALVVWIGYGGDIFTKTEVLVEVQDELYDNVKEWKDQFVLGLDYTLGFIGGVVALTLLSLYLLRNKKV